MRGLRREGTCRAGVKHCGVYVLEFKERMQRLVGGFAYICRIRSVHGSGGARGGAEWG